MATSGGMNEQKLDSPDLKSENIIEDEQQVATPIGTSATEIQNSNSVTMTNNGKTFEYHLGAVYEQAEFIFVETEEKTVNISLYDWYAVEYYNGNLYLANILSVDNPEEIGVVGIFVYPIGSYLFAVHEMFNIDYLTQLW